MYSQSPMEESRPAKPAPHLSVERRQSLKTHPKKVPSKSQNSSISITVQIERYLKKADKQHNNLWETTQNAITQISKIVGLLQSVNQIAEEKATSESSLNNGKNKKTGPATAEILGNQDRKQLTRALNQRLENLAMIQKLLQSPYLLSEESDSLLGETKDAIAQKVLIVDDDPVSTRLTSHFLRNAQYAVTCASDGKEGLRKTLDNPPDIILIDIMMPGLDGFQLLTRLKKETTTLRIPVIVISSLSNDQEILRGLKEGAIDFITKPFSPQVLLAKIERALDMEKCICP